MKKQLLGAAVAMTLLKVPMANAAVTLLDKDDWKITMNGFVESDIISDSTRSFTEIIGNAPVARGGTFAGDNPRMMFSARNSRLGFGVYAPEQDGWKSKGVIEMDFFGYNPTPQGPAGGANSETGFYQNPAPRMRHAYLSVEKEGWQFTAGQTWSLFGWQPYYQPTIETVAPAPGELFQRNMQFTAMKTMTAGESNKIQAAISLERPSQRDSNMPNLNLGVRWALDSFRSVYASSYGDLKTESLSVGLSGTFRQFEYSNSNTSTSSEGHTNGSAVALDILVPLIPASDVKDTGNSLTLTGEFTSGKGYADSLPNWTGGFNAFTASNTGTSSATRTNMDAGFGGYTDAAGNDFDLIQLQTWNVSLQYVMPSNWRSWLTAGYTELSATNMGSFNQTVSATATNSAYDKTSMYFINFNHDLTNQLRVALEYDKLTTHYYDDKEPSNDRIQFTALYRFM